MSRLGLVGGALAAVAVAVGSLVGGGYVWAASAADAALDRPWVVHAGDFPVPWPLTEEELAALDGADPESVARERARERGEHLVLARYGCVECHGNDLGGGKMVDDGVIGQILGPNLTLGRGSATATYTPADWDRKVRHGVRPDGRSGPMPSEDYVRMSDQELSDLVTYIRSVPPVDREIPPVALGPLGTVLLATGELVTAAHKLDERGQQVAQHPELPPRAEASVAFGEHLAATCTGCHGPELAGGPIVGGDPSWPPAANLTPHAEGLSGWTFEDFVKAMRLGQRKDGQPVKLPMTFFIRYANEMTDVELQAIWAYLQQLPPQPDPA